MDKRKILITGASGFLAKELIGRLLEDGHTVYGIYHKPPEAKLAVFLEPLIGDIVKPNFGLQKVPSDIDAIYHLAALLDLGDKHKDRVWEVNVEGTRNVLKFMKSHNIPHLLFCSTAYTQGRNYYEHSKTIAEAFILVSGLKYTIFKPSIIVPSSKTFKVEKPQHLYIAVGLLARIHRRAEIVRRSIEGTLHLPPKEIGFRVKADPDATLDLVPVDWVAEKMTTVQKEGRYWLTNPAPVKVSDLLEWVGEVLFLRLKAEPEFKMTPIEALFDRLARPFLNYLQGDIPEFTSSFDDCPYLGRDFIEKTIINSLLT